MPEDSRQNAAGPAYAPPAAQVLIVEDEVDHADVMAEALKKYGHVCTVVACLIDAGTRQQLCCAGPVDQMSILTSIDLPPMAT